MKGYERKWLLQVCNVITEQLLQRNIVYTVKKKAKIKKKKKNQGKISSNKGEKLERSRKPSDIVRQVSFFLIISRHATYFHVFYC